MINIQWYNWSGQQRRTQDLSRGRGPGGGFERKTSPFWYLKKGIWTVSLSQLNRQSNAKAWPSCFSFLFIEAIAPKIEIWWTLSPTTIFWKIKKDPAPAPHFCLIVLYLLQTLLSATFLILKYANIHENLRPHRRRRELFHASQGII